MIHNPLLVCQGETFEVLVKTMRMLMKAKRFELEACSLVMWHSFAWGNVSLFLEKA